jgi:hypothetical protein
VCISKYVYKLQRYKTIILPAVLYGCESWSLTLRQQHRLRVFENRVLLRIFGPKRFEGMKRRRNCIKLHDLYSPPSTIRIIKSRRMRWSGHAGRMREKMNAYSLLAGKPERKRPLRTPIRRWADKIKMNLIRDRKRWCGSGEGQMNNSCVCGKGPSGSINC